MKQIQLNIEAIKSQYPRAWKDFEDFHQELLDLNKFSLENSFETLPFEYQLGVFYRYFTENGVGCDICNMEFEMIPFLIEENFKGQNQLVAHYS